MEELMNQMKRKGLFPQDGTLEQFRKQYGTSEKMTNLHSNLVTEDVLDQSLMDVGDFTERFNLSGIMNPKNLSGNDPFRVDEDDLLNQEVNASTINLDLNINVEDWYRNELAKIKGSENEDSQLKMLNKEYLNQKEKINNLNLENQAKENLLPFQGSDTYNPLVQFRSESKALSVARRKKDYKTDAEYEYALAQAKLEDEEGEKMASNGLHSWMWPESVNLKNPQQSSEKGTKDTEFDLANKLWTISDEWDGDAEQTLVPVLKQQYPGYSFEIERAPGPKKKSIDDNGIFSLSGVQGQAITVTAPNGEKTTIYGGIKGESMLTNDSDIKKAIIESKTTLTNFINTNGIDLKDVSRSMSSSVQHYENLINTPYNSENSNAGGIGLDTEQQRTADGFGRLEYVKNKDGKIETKFLYNDDIFKGSRQIYADQLFSQGLISEEVRANAYTTGAQIIDDFILKNEGAIELGGEGYNFNQNKNTTLGQQQPTLGQSLLQQKLDPNNIITIAKETDWINPLAGEALRDRVKDSPQRYGGDYFGPQSTTWKNVKASLEPAYKKAGVELTDDIIKTVIAQTEQEKYVAGAIDANLDSYLWNASNNNYKQAMAMFEGITTRDAKLNTAMGLQALNETEIANYNKMSPDLAVVDFFESTYDNPNSTFEIPAGVETTVLNNGKEVPISTFNEYVAAKKRRDAKMQTMLDRRSKQWDLQDEVGDIDANFKLLEKEYNAWNSSLATLGLTFADIGTGITYLAGKATKYTGIGAGTYWVGEALSMYTGEDNMFTDFWDDWDKEWASAYDDYSAWKEGVKEQYGREVSFHEDKFGRGGAFKASNFGRFVGQEVAKQIPILATMMASGGTAGPLLIGAYSAGQHWADADRKEYLTGKKENEWLQAAQAIGYGASEAIFERLTTVPILARGGKLLQGAGKESMLSYKNAMKQYFKENAVHLATDPILEASAEFGTQITQNWIDGRDLLEGADHAAFVGGMFGHAMSVTPFMAGAVARQFTDYNSFQGYAERQNKINTLERNLATQKANNLISDQGVKLREEIIADLKKEQEAHLESKYSNIVRGLDNKALESFKQSTYNQARISEEANKMMDGKAPSNPQLLQTLKTVFDAEQHNRDVWRNNGDFSNTFTLLQSTDKQAYDNYLKEAKNELTNKKGKDGFREEEVIPLAEKLYKKALINEDFNNKQSVAGKTYLKFDENTSALDYINEQLEISKQKINADESLSDQQKKDKIISLERGVSDAKGNISKGLLSGWALTLDANGVITTDAANVDKSIVMGFVENAITNNETQIFTHEVGHDVMGEILGYDSKAFEPIAKEIELFLKKDHADIWEAMQMRRGSELMKADEVVMNFFEYVGKGKIDFKNKNGNLFSSSFGFSLNNIFKKNNKKQIDFAGSNDIINFMVQMGRDISSGRISAKTIADAKKSKVIVDAKKKYEAAKKKYENQRVEAAAKKVLKESGIDVSKMKFSSASSYNTASEVVSAMNDLIKENKKTPVKGYRDKLSKLTNRFKELKDTRITDKVPQYKEGETDLERKERTNLTERSFRGKLDARKGAAMNEIVKGYEEKMLRLAIKNGYFKTDAYQSFDSVEEAKQEFLSEARIALIKGIRTFNSAKNNDFDAFIMGQLLSNKVKDAHNAIVKRYGNKEGGFTTGLESASNMASEQSQMQEMETTLRELLGVKKGSPFYGAAMEAVQEVMKEGLPTFDYVQRKKKGKGDKVTIAQVRKVLAKNPTGEARLQAERDLAGIMKKVKSELEASYKKALDKTVKKEFLNTKAYDNFLKRNRNKLMRMLPIEDLVALERLVKPDSKIFTGVEIMDKETGRTVLNPTEVKKYEGSGNLTTATTTQGPQLYKRKNPTEKQFVDFFNVRGRKDALAKILSGYLGLDATMQNLTSEKVVDEISRDNPTIKEQLGEQALKDFALAIKRGTNFKFSLASTVGMSGNIAEDYKSLQVDLIDQIINMEVSDPMSVKLAVDVVYSDKKFAPYRSKIKDVFEKLLKPYRKAVTQEGKTDFNLEEYITSVEAALDGENSISKMWGQKPMAQALKDADDIANFKKFDNRLAQQRLLDLAGKDKNGKQKPVTEQMKIEQAAQDLRWQHGRQKGTKPGTAKARGMVYASPAQLFDEFFLPNYGFKGRKLNGKGENRTLQFIREDNSLTEPIPFRSSPAQVVTEAMIPGGTMPQTEIDFREEIADQAFNYVVNSYKAAKTLLDNGGGTKLDMAMLMNMYGQFMEGPIRAAAPFRYRPLDAPTTKLRDKDGNKMFEYEHGIPAKIFNLLVADAVFFNNKKINLQTLKDSYAVGAIPVDMNDNFSVFFADRMQFDYKVGDIAPMRWYNKFTRGKAAYAVEDVRTGDRFGEKEAKLWQSIKKASEVNKYSLSNNVVNMKDLNAEEVLSYAATVDAALKIARDPNAEEKKIRVFDFDDTLATSNNVVFYTMPDGSKGQLNAEEFAKKGLELKEQGAVMDFSDFNTVRDGGEGPLADLARTIIEKRGSEDVFVLTARAQESAQAIYDFLQGVGIKIPLKNITGLGNSTGEAKAQWIIGKAAEGYNDFYFADDAPQNVKAVRDALDVIDVKSKVQQAKFKFSQNVDRQFNDILENSFGVEWYKEFSPAKAKILGEQNQKRKLHPYSAEDFEGLLYPLLGKGKKGEAAYEWFNEHLMKPYTRGVQNLATDRINVLDDYKALTNDVMSTKTLKETNSTGFTNENSARVYVWNSLDQDIPGLSKKDLADILQEVESNPDLKLFAESLLAINKGDYVSPGQDWLGGTIGTDILETLNKNKRQDYLSTWKENVDIIFSEKNLNKLEAVLGVKYVEALKNSLARMEAGTNRLYSNSKLANNVLDYLNNAQGVVMFLNMRSALLQGISFANFINWDFNNPLKAGKAFANQPQYWSDFMELMNSDYLKDRRGGLKMNINEAEVTQAAKTAKNKAKAVVSYIIEKGYTPTKFMDSFAIASGGATWYRNRINNLLETNPDMSLEQAKAKAMEEFREIAEKSQQSSDPSKISSQQASTMGRLFLNWANTQMQYVRIQKKAVQDIANGRGDTKSHISKIIYYGAIQNLWFQAAHTAVFALAFNDDDDSPEYEKFKDDKTFTTANGMVDNVLRGLGFGGQLISVLKNLGLDIYERSDRKRPEYVDSIWEIVKLSPVVSSKISRLKSAAWYFDSKDRRQEMIDKGFSLDNPAYDATAKVISAITNVPLDRLLLKMDNIMAASKDETEFWMDVALLLGWPEWTLKPKEKSTKTNSKQWGDQKKSNKGWGNRQGYKSQWGVKKPVKQD